MQIQKGHFCRDYTAVYALVRQKWGAKLKGRAEVMKKKLEAVEVFVSTFQDQVSEAIREKASDLPGSEDSQDSDFCVIRRRISLPGIKPIAKVEEKYESVYLYGAVDPRTGDSFFLEFSDLTADCFQLFLDQFSEAFPESLNLWCLIMDAIMPSR